MHIGYQLLYLFSTSIIVGSFIHSLFNDKALVQMKGDLGGISHMTA